MSLLSAGSISLDSTFKGQCQESMDMAGQGEQKGKNRTDLA
jgi:hypothetical protein